MPTGTVTLLLVGFYLSAAESDAARSGNCSWVLTADSGFIKSPNYGLALYDNNVDCDWTVHVPGRQDVIQIWIEDLSIEIGDCAIKDESCCQYDFVEIYDGASASSPLLEKICGFSAPSESYVTSGNEALIKFHSDCLQRSRGFSLTYNSRHPGSALHSNTRNKRDLNDIDRCPDEPFIVTNERSIHSPGFDNYQYNNYDNCQWLIKAPRQSKIRLQFVEIDIEWEENCEYDSLKIYDGEDEDALSLGNYCGFSSGVIHFSTGNHMLVTFLTDELFNEGAFEFEVAFVRPDDYEKVHAGCGSEPARLDETEGGLTSPSQTGSDNYPNNAHCSWIIKAPTEMYVHLKFEFFDLEETFRGRCLDAVKVYDGNSDRFSLLKSLCGRRQPSDISSTGSWMFIEFSSDRSVTATGFKVRFSAKKIEENEGGFCRRGLGSTSPAGIIMGREALPNSLPWQTSLRYRHHHNFGHWCGGSIIARNWVMTAAHCIFDLQRNMTANFKVQVGGHSEYVQEANEKVVDIADYFIHEHFDGNTFDNDIALLRLVERLNFNEDVKPLCLSTTDVSPQTVCRVAGWGESQGRGGEDILHEVDVPIVEESLCRSWHGSKVTANMLCAGYEKGGKDACSGDSGGALVCRRGGRYEQHGIVSWGYGCGVARKPGVYTRVSRYSSWIVEKTGGL